MPTPGTVVYMRVNPTDQMSVVDILDVIGQSKENLSFNAAAKIAFATLLESARQAGTIPRRDGFEYGEMLQPFERENLKNRAAKLLLTKELSKPPRDDEPLLTPGKQARLLELRFKHEQDPANMDTGELEELSRLLSEVQS